MKDDDKITRQKQAELEEKQRRAGITPRPRPVNALQELGLSDTTPAGSESAPAPTPTPTPTPTNNPVQSQADFSGPAPSSEKKAKAEKEYMDRREQDRRKSMGLGKSKNKIETPNQEEEEIMAKPTYFTQAEEGFYRVKPIGRIEYLNLFEAKEKEWQKVKAVIGCPILEGKHKGKRPPFYQTLELDENGNPLLGENTKLGQILARLGQKFDNGSKINLKLLEREMIAEVKNSTREKSTLRKVVNLYTLEEYEAMLEKGKSINEG